MADIRQTAILDDCTRADEDPLRFGGKWAPVYPPIATGWNAMGELKLIGGQIHNTGVIPNSTQVSYWTPLIVHDPAEVWGYVGPGHDLSEGLRLFLFLSAVTYEQTNGYELNMNDGVGGESWGISRWDNGVKTPLIFDAVGFPGTNEAILLRCDRGVVSAWRDAGTRTTWSQVFSYDDSASPLTFGYLGLGTDQDDNNPDWIGFGGGQLRRTQIFRISPLATP